MSEEVELDFRDWLSKVNERLTFILLNIKEHRDLIEPDRDVLESMYSIYNEGYLPFYVNKLKLTDRTAVEQDLFNDRTTSAGNGIKIDYTLSNNKNRKI